MPSLMASEAITVSNPPSDERHPRAQSAGRSTQRWGMHSSRFATSVVDGKVFVEIHDSGPGLSEDASRSLFEPTITFKKRGMGLGLSIARKSALMNGGDIMLVKSELGGAAFRVVLPRV